MICNVIKWCDYLSVFFTLTWDRYSIGLMWDWCQVDGRLMSGWWWVDGGLMVGWFGLLDSLCLLTWVWPSKTFWNVFTRVSLLRMRTAHSRKGQKFSPTSVSYHARTPISGPLTHSSYNDSYSNMRSVVLNFSWCLLKDSSSYTRSAILNL